MFVLVGLLGCAGGSGRPPQPGAISSDDAEPWFCQMGRQGQWACVRDSDLARNPTPARLPQAEPPAFQDPPRLDSAEPETRSANLPEPADATAMAGQPTASAQRPAEPTRAAPPGEPVKSGQGAAVPAYLRLAYQPDAPMALTDLPPDLYAVQLLAMTGADALETYARERGLPRLSAARVERDGELFYVLLLGVYRTRADAEAAVADMPKALHGLTPWIRPLGSLQAAMRRAQTLAEPDGTGS